MNKEVRWKQRFSNFEKAFLQLKKGTEQKQYTPLEKEGLIQRFEFTFELAWKTLKDYLESQGVEARYPRDVIKEAFRYELIKDGEKWIDMLEKRNLMAHTYDEKSADFAFQIIRENYFFLIEQVFELLDTYQ